MALPRYHLSEEESSFSDLAITRRLSSPELDARPARTDDDGDTTVPASFVLELSDTIVRQVSALRPLTITSDVAWPLPPAPWPLEIDETRAPRERGEGMNLLSIAASFVLGTAMVIAGMTGTPSPDSEHITPIGIAVHTPKTLDRSVRTGNHVGGFSPRLDGATVSVETLARPRRRY